MQDTVPSAVSIAVAIDAMICTIWRHHCPENPKSQKQLRK
jgi:hypothetical protein